MLEKAYRSWPAIVRFYLPFSEHFTFLIGHYMTIKFFHFYQGNEGNCAIYSFLLKSRKKIMKDFPKISLERKSIFSKENPPFA